MTPCQASEPNRACQDPFRWDRSDAVALLEQALDADEPTSLRGFAASHDVPYATLHYWRQRRDRLDVPQRLRDFFESPTGLDFLRRLVLAAHLSFQQTGLVGLRSLTSFFRHAQLEPFLACSYGSHQRLASTLQGLVVGYGQDQRQQLAPAMPARAISLCEDENFHQGPPCLVAIEPGSNFLLVEVCCPRRDAATWNQVVHTGLQGLAVSVIQVSSDEAKGILAHVKDGLGAHHSPDLMHLQQDLHRATSLSLRTRVEQAQQQVNEAEYQGLLAWLDRDEWLNGPRRPGRPADVEGRYAQRKAQLRQADEQLAAAQQRQHQAQEAIRGLGDDYHPFDVTTGAAQSPEALQQRLHQRLAVVSQAAEQAGLGPSSRQKIKRVSQMIPQLVATLAWFWLQVRGLAQAGGWSAAEQELLHGPVLAWVYFQQASRRGRDAEHRQQLAEVAERCRAFVEASPVWQAMTEAQQQQLLATAREGAGRWVRSSSCVEGRNGYLRLRHHGRRGLTGQALAALTVLHNYWLVRPDGTTAAERFFGQPPEDLFTWLLQRFPQLPRPAPPRRQRAA